MVSNNTHNVSKTKQLVSFLSVCMSTATKSVSNIATIIYYCSKSRYATVPWQPVAGPAASALSVSPLPARPSRGPPRSSPAAPVPSSPGAAAPSSEPPPSAGAVGSATELEQTATGPLGHVTVTCSCCHAHFSRLSSSTSPLATLSSLSICRVWSAAWRCSESCSE